jgi:molecular chaperone DnaJ
MFEEILGGLGGARRAPRPRPGRDVRVPLHLSFEDSITGVERTVAYRHGGGAGKTRVAIPPGVKDGATIRVSGKGEPSPSGGPAGNLLLDVTVQPHARLQRQGNDLRAEVPITVYEAVLGGKIKVPTLNGDATINLPANTRTGQVFRLGGKGVAPATGKPGDLLVKVMIQPPAQPDAKLVALMEAFRGDHPYDPRAEEPTAL